jgi:hypothetical protein
MFACLPLPLLQLAVNEVQRNTQAPQGLVWFSALAAVALASQGLIDVETPIGSVVPTSLMLIAVAKSGERKSTVENKFFEKFREFESKQAGRINGSMQEYREEMVIWKTKCAAYTKLVQYRTFKGEPSVVEEEELLTHLRSRPTLPRKFKMLYEDATTQALFCGLHQNFPSAGLVSSEGSGILNGTALNDFAKQNALWSGDTVTVDRAVAESYHLAEARLTVSVVVQPAALEAFMDRRGASARGTGLLARFLVCDAGTTQGSRFLENGTLSWQHIGKFGDRIVKFLEMNVAFADDASAFRKSVKFSPEAAANWLAIYNDIESKVGHGLPYAEAGDHASKLAENIARVAALLHYFEGFEGDISPVTLNCAYMICNESSIGFLRLFVPPLQEVTDASNLNNWLEFRFRSVNCRFVKRNHVLQFGPNMLREKNRLNQALVVLQDQGLIAMCKKDKTWFIDVFPKMGASFDERWGIALTPPTAN